MKSWQLALGEGIRARRKALGLSQEQLAELAGAKPLFVHEVETGKTNPRIGNVLQLLQILGLQLSLQNGRATFEVLLDHADD